MPPQKRKASGRKGSSKKKNVMYSTPEHVGLFGVHYKSLVKTPLGTTVEVEGVRYDTPGDVSTARLYVKYPNGTICPVEPRTAAEMIQLGYHILPEWAHIERDLAGFYAERRTYEEKIAAFDLLNRLRVEALSLETRGKKKGPGATTKVGGAPRPVTR